MAWYFVKKHRENFLLYLVYHNAAAFGGVTRTGFIILVGKYLEMDREIH
jgi:hypothetical protein